MTVKSLVLSVAMATAALAAAPTVYAEELVIGVFLPQAPFATNAERATWADKLAADLAAKSGGAFTARAQVFARREDVGAFAGKVDLLVLDGLYAAERGGEVIGHVSGSPAVGLYVASGANVGELQGKDISLPEAGAGDINFYANTALAGEIPVETFFGAIKRAKDAAAALGAVKAGTASGAFAPVGHPAATGLKVVAQGGSYPVGVLVVANKAKVDAVRAALTSALAGGAGGGGLGAVVPGAGEAYQAARGLKGTPRVMTVPALLTGGVDAKPVAPPIRLRARGQMPAPAFDAQTLVQPTLPEPPL